MRDIVLLGHVRRPLLKFWTKRTKRVEQHLCGFEAFNSGKWPRKTWQSGEVLSDSKCFIVTAPMFARKTLYARMSKKLRYKLHPWVEEALKDNDKLVPSPDCPHCMVWEDGNLLDLDDSDRPQLEKYDIMWISFTLAFYVGGETWGPEYRPMDLIRVGHMPENYGESTDHSAIPCAGRDPLLAGKFILPAASEYILRSDCRQYTN